MKKQRPIPLNKFTKGDSGGIRSEVQLFPLSYRIKVRNKGTVPVTAEPSSVPLGLLPSLS